MLKRMGLLEKAITRYQEVLTTNPEDKTSLVEKSKCYLLSGNPTAALADADRVLQVDKTLLSGMLQKAEALFNKGEFEMALVYFQRGKRMRPSMAEFNIGIQKCRQAIENSIGSADRIKLTLKGDLSYFQEEDRKLNHRYSYHPKASAKSSSRLNTIRKSTSLQSAHYERIKQELLGDLYKERKFLAGMLKSEEALSYSLRNLVHAGKEQETDKATKTTIAVFDLAEKGVSYLDERAEFWRNHKPLFARQYERSALKNAFCRRQHIKNDHFIRELEKIDEAYEDSRCAEVLKLAQACMRALDDYSESQVSNKAALKAQLHSYMGNCYLELEDYGNALRHHHHDFYMAEKMGSKEALSRSLDNLGRTYARMGELVTAIRTWETKLDMSRTPLERAWLCYEIGKCYLERDKRADAMNYAEMALAAGQEANDPIWQMHASVLKGKIAFRKEDYETSYQAFREALKLARSVNDAEAETAIGRSMTIAYEKILPSAHESSSEPFIRKMELQRFEHHEHVGEIQEDGEGLAEEDESESSFTSVSPEEDAQK